MEEPKDVYALEKELARTSSEKSVGDKVQAALADLPDPDEGKTDEEKAALVSSLSSLCRAISNTEILSRTRHSFAKSTDG